MKRVALLLALATPLFAQSVAVIPRGVVVAHDGVVDVFDAKTLERVSRIDGVPNPGVIATDGDNFAVLDPLNDRLRLANGEGHRTGQTPLAAAFVDHELYVLERDSRTLSNSKGSVHVAAGAQWLGVANGKLYVYGAITGVLQEITTSPFAVARELPMPRFATDMEVDKRAAYLAYPQEKLVRVVNIVDMKDGGKVEVGAVPVDIALAGDPTLVTAQRLAVADPSSKRIWLIEGSQTTAEAFGRGFLRGVLGLGLFSSRDRNASTGIDRVISRGTQWVAYDSASGDVTQFTKSDVKVLAKGLPPHAFALGNHVLYFWQNGTLVAQKTVDE